MIRINLLPHREMRRERRKKDFVAFMLLVVVFGASVALLVALGIGQRIDAQQARNDYIKRENDKLDAQIKEIALLRQEIDSLRARQLAVENLQRDRTLPVHVMDELVKYTPDGIYFKQVKQEERKVSLVGVAQSNERVSNLLRSLSYETPWLERPELVEIKAAPAGKPDAKDTRRVFEFAVNAMVKTPAATDAKPAASKPVADAAAASAVVAAK
jgi:type IV pilus assembly protein PilN